MESEQQKESTKPKRNRFSLRKLALFVGITVILIVTLGFVLSMNYFTPSSIEPSISFDFDTGSPLLAEGQNMPFNQTSEGITANFNSPSDNVGASAFSIQRYETTFIKLAQFSGNYLYDNKPSTDILEIGFSQQLKSISLTFATVEYSPETSDIVLTAYLDSTGTPPVGQVTAQGTYSNELYPQGTISFSSGTPFNIVRIEIPNQGSEGATNFFVDNVKIKLMQEEQ